MACSFPSVPDGPGGECRLASESLAFYGAWHIVFGVGTALAAVLALLIARPLFQGRLRSGNPFFHYYVWTGLVVVTLVVRAIDPQGYRGWVPLVVANAAQVFSAGYFVSMGFKYLESLRTVEKGEHHVAPEAIRRAYVIIQIQCLVLVVAQAALPDRFWQVQAAMYVVFCAEFALVAFWGFTISARLLRRYLRAASAVESSNSRPAQSISIFLIFVELLACSTVGLYVALALYMLVHRPERARDAIADGLAEFVLLSVFDAGHMLVVYALFVFNYRYGPTFTSSDRGSTARGSTKTDSRSERSGSRGREQALQHL